MRVQFRNGSNARGLAEYLLNEKKQREVNRHLPEGYAILTTNMSGRNPQELAAEAQLFTDQNSRVRVTTRHFSVSLSPGEKLTAENKARITRDILQKTGHKDCPFYAVEHFNRVDENDIEHWHIAVTSVDKDGKWINDAYLVNRLSTLERELERDYGLVQVADRSERERRNLTPGEYHYKQQQIEATGDRDFKLPKEKLWEAIDIATTDQPSLAMMTARLKSQGIGVQFKQIEGEIGGISFEIEGKRFRGQNLGKAFTLPGLQRNNFVQEHGSDQTEQLIEIETMTVQQCQDWLQKEQSKQHYRDLYQLYLPKTKLPPEDQDRFVAARTIRALAAKNLQRDALLKEVFLTIGNGENTQRIKIQDGQEAAKLYAQKIAAEAWEQEQGRQAQQSRARQRSL
jgi:hypothetical protein